MSAPADPYENSGPTVAAPTSRGSRLRPGRPAARPRYAASTWSGPTLNPAVFRPRARDAASSPTATAVLPWPEDGAAITTRGTAGLGGSSGHGRPGPGAGVPRPGPQPRRGTPHGP